MWEFKPIPQKARFCRQTLRQIRVQVEVTLGCHKDLPTRYTGSVKAIGFFRVSPEVPDSELQAFAATAGASVLFGMIREMISNVTARGPWPMLQLPLMTFQNLTRVDEPAG
jgi:preprotein translocase subunit SecB